MDLNQLWFLLIGVLFTGFFFLEGFDYGVGILLRVLGKTEEERRAIINTIGPFWDANEVWLLTAGGAMFAAFPQWYATLFSGFYLALLLILVALILRGVAFEFRSKDKRPGWRNAWDWALTIGSALPALLLSVAFANLVRGVPIDAQMRFTGNLFTLLNPYALVAGLYGLALLTLHGAVFLTLKTEEPLAGRARALAARLWVPAIVLLVAALVYSYLDTPMRFGLGLNPGVVPILGAAALLAAGWFIRSGRTGWAFVMTGLTVVASVFTVFATLYPNVMRSTTDPAYSLTIYNASSSPYTLQVMSIVALVFVPIVLLYQGWTYWVFRKRVMVKPHQG